MYKKIYAFFDFDVEISSEILICLLKKTRENRDESSKWGNQCHEEDVFDW